MGVDVHVLNFLRWSSKKSKRFGKVITIGRQGVDIPPALLRKLISLPPDYQYSQYCEELLTKVFKAECVHSIDNSDFEGCSYVMDMNRSIVPPGQYDTVIDAGCLEHVYNIPQALLNVSSLTTSGGQIIHILPCNNFCGHGFWQFSPELFYSLYSKKNGYSNTEVFVVDLSDKNVWYEVIPPENGRRAVIFSDRELYVLCRTVKCGDSNHSNVQQSDYVLLWDNKKAGYDAITAPNLWRRLKISGERMGFFKFLTYITPMGLRRKRSNELSNRNPSLIKRLVSDMVER